VSPEIATIVYAIGILILFVLDFDPQSQPSKALWIPALWLLIEASRPVSFWLQMAPPPTAATYLEGSPLDRDVFLCLSVIGLVVLAARGQQLVTLLRSNRAVLLFFLYCGVSVLWSDYSDVAFRRWVKAMGEFVMVLIVLTDAHPVATVKRLLSRAGFLLLPLSVLFVKYYGELGRNYRPGDFGSGWQTMNIGVTTDKNALGMIAMAFGIAALWQLLELRHSKVALHRRRRIVAQGALLSSALWVLSRSNSMTSFSCFAVGGALLLLIDSWALFRRRAVLGTAVVAILCLALFSIFVAPNLVSVVGRDPTLTGRTEVWSQVLNLTGYPLLGTGFESFWLGSRLQKMWSLYWWHPNEAHNGYLEVFLNLGWVGVVLLAILLWTGFRNGVTAVRQRAEAGGLMLAYCVVTLLYNLTESAFRALDPMWFIFLLSIIAIPQSFISDNPAFLDIKEVDELAEAEAEFHHLVRAGSLR
jgi:exopolysaccharide production protein ExoQ